MKYIVKNCPCYTLKGGYYDCWANQDSWCENISDCIIKQVVERCVDEINDSDRCDRWSESRAFAKGLLQLFDIEEINK